MGTEKRPPGRPPVDGRDPCIGVHVRLPSKQYDALLAAARQARISVPELVRRACQALGPTLNKNT